MSQVQDPNNTLNEVGLSKPKQILLALAIVLAIIAILFFNFGFKWMAQQQVKDPNQLLEGCLQYKGHSINKTYFNFAIDGVETTDRDGFLKQFSIANQSLKPSVTTFMTYVRANPNICHPVEYVNVDWALFDKVYVTKYLGDELNLSTVNEK